MNATRAATIRLRSSFDGAVSLGRVQTPTLAIIARREEEIRAFKPEPYWLVDAQLRADGRRARAAATRGRYHDGSQPRLKTAAGGRGDRRRRPRPARARSPSSRRPSAPRRRRCCTTSRRCSARPTRATASPRGARWRPPSGSTRSTRRSPTRVPTRASCPRTWAARSSRSPSYVGDAARVREGRRLRDRARRAADRARDQRREGHRPPRDHPDPLRAPRRQDVRRRPAHLRHGRPPLPGRLPSRGRVREHAPGDHGRRARLPHPRPRAARGRLARRLRRGGARVRLAVGLRRRRGRPAARCPSSSAARPSTRARSPPRRRSPSRRAATPTRRCWRAMETAGKLVDDDELREAMKDSGIGTPATRAAIIERLIDVGYVERDGRSLVATEKGLNVIRLLGEHPLTSPSLTGDWEHAAGQDRARRGAARGVHARHRAVRRRDRARRSTPSSRTSASRAPTSARARSAATTSSRTARASPAGRARTRAAAS